jgi:hypothetical protein
MEENNLVIIDADSMIYIIGSELEPATRASWYHEIRRVYFRYSYHRIKRLLRRREEISEKISLLLSPTKGPGQKTSSYFGSLYSKNDRTLGISTL